MREAAFYYTVISLYFKIVHCCYLPIPTSNSACSSLKPHLVSRSRWRAADPSGPMECMKSPAEYVIIHHTASAPCSTHKTCRKAMRTLQKEHKKEKDWPDIGYHFIIGGDSKAYVGRHWHLVGAHTKYHNRQSIGIAFIGDFQKDCPIPEMLNLVPEIVYCGVEMGYISPDFLVIGHRDAYCSSCPGDALYEVIKTWPRFPKVTPIPTYTCEVRNDSSTTTAAPETTTTTTEPPETTTELATTTEATTTPGTTDADKYYFVVLLKKASTCCIK